MATYISTTQEEARKKLAAKQPMTSLTRKTIQSPATTPVAKPAAPLSMTRAIPKATTTAPARMAVQAPSAIPAAPPIGTTQTNAAPLPPAQAAPPPAPPVVPPTMPAPIPPPPAGGEDGGAGEVALSNPYEEAETDDPALQENGDGGVTAASIFDGKDDQAKVSREARKQQAVQQALIRRFIADNPDAMGEEVQREQDGNGGLAREEEDIVDFEADPNINQNIDGLLEDFVRDGLQGETYDDVEINADPYEDVSIDHKTDREMDSASRRNIMKLLGYDEGDTGDEEKYIETRVADRLGQQLVGSRASMGRAGFGASGALYGMEGDQMRQANLDAEGRIYDVREREQNQAFERNMAGAGLADDRDERLYDRATDNAELDFRNQDESYDRATDQADLDHRNQTTEFGQQVSVADLDQRIKQGVRQDAILKAKMDEIDALTAENGTGADENNDGIPDDEQEQVPRNSDGSADPRDPNGPNGRFGYVPEVAGRIDLDPAHMDDVANAELRDRRLMLGDVDWYFGSDDQFDYYESQVDGKIMKVARDGL